MADAPQNDLGKRAVNAILLWKLAILELFILCATTAGTFYLSGTGDEEWYQMSAPARMRFKVGMALAILGQIKSFLSTTVATLKKGGNLPPDMNGNGDTKTWATRQTRTDVVQVQTPPAPSV
jgi:hypothetical protein